MKNFLFAFIVFLMYSVFGMWYYSCVVKGLCGNDTTSEVDINNSVTAEDSDLLPAFDNLSADGFVLRDAQGTSFFSFTDNLNISKNKSSVIIPSSSAAFKDSIFQYLNSHQNKELVITGLRTSEENANIGLERAKAVKTILETFGINADKLSVAEAVKAFSFDSKGEFSGGLNMTFKDLSAARLSEIESGIANKTLYSGFASKGFKADNTLQAYALELRGFLEKYPKKMASITGHTDSVGDDIANDWFGMERAKNVKKYLVTQGIMESRLKALTQGEKAPIDNNNTLEGRRKNRRIEINVN